MVLPFDDLPTIDHVGFLEDLSEMPHFLNNRRVDLSRGQYSCSFCGVGDSGLIHSQPLAMLPPTGGPTGEGILKVELVGKTVSYRASLSADGHLEVETDLPF